MAKLDHQMKGNFLKSKIDKNLLEAVFQALREEVQANRAEKQQVLQQNGQKLLDIVEKRLVKGSFLSLKARSRRVGEIYQELSQKRSEILLTGYFGRL